MKRGISAIIILTCCIIFAIAVTVTLENKAESLHSVALAAADDKKFVYALEDAWEKEIVYFELFTDHSYFENIDKKIKKLRYLDGKTYRNTCREAVIDLIELKEHLTFSFPNIF